MPKVDITTAGHTVIVEANDVSLDWVAAKALDLWRQTRDPKLDRAWGVTAAVTEVGRGEYVSGYDGDLHRPQTVL